MEIVLVIFAIFLLCFFAAGYMFSKTEDQMLAEEKERRDASIKADVEEYHKSQKDNAESIPGIRIAYFKPKVVNKPTDEAQP